MSHVDRLAELLRSDDDLIGAQPAHGTNPVGVFARPAPGIEIALVFPRPLQLLGADVAGRGAVRVFAHLGHGRIASIQVPAARVAHGDFWHEVAQALPGSSLRSASPRKWLAGFMDSPQWPAFLDAVGRWLRAAGGEGPEPGRLRVDASTLLEAALYRSCARVEASVAASGDGVALEHVQAILVDGARIPPGCAATLLGLTRGSDETRFVREAMCRLPAPLLRLAARPAPDAQPLRAALTGCGSIVDALNHVGISTPVARRILAAPGEVPPRWSVRRFLGVARMAACLEPEVIPASVEAWLALAAAAGLVREIDGDEALQHQHLRWIFAYGPAAVRSRAWALQVFHEDLVVGGLSSLPIGREAVRAAMALSTRSRRSSSHTLDLRFRAQSARWCPRVAELAAEFVVGRGSVEDALQWVAGAARPRAVHAGGSEVGLGLRLLSDGAAIRDHGQRMRNCLADPYSALRYLSRGRVLFAVESDVGTPIGTVAARIPHHDRDPDPQPRITEMSGIANARLGDAQSTAIDGLFRLGFAAGHDRRDWLLFLRRSRRLAQAVERAARLVIVGGAAAGANAERARPASSRAG